MKVAFAIWDGRISPVFDTARELMVVYVDNGHITERYNEHLGEQTSAQRIAKLNDLGVETLICGAISRPMADLLIASGIHLLPFIAGNIEEVITALLNDQLPGPDFLMPGCCAGGRRRQRQCNTTGENVMMNKGQGRGRGQGGGQGGGRGQGGGGGQGGRGRMGGTAAGGPVGNCVCPQCNEEIAHQRGVPCSAQICPKCGVALIRVT